MLLDSATTLLWMTGGHRQLTAPLRFIELSAAFSSALMRRSGVTNAPTHPAMQGARKGRGPNP